MCIRPLTESYQNGRVASGFTRIEHSQQEIQEAELADHALRVVISENVPGRVGRELRAPLAEGVRTGNAENQFNALRFYWSAAGLCNLLDACTQP